MDYSQLCTLAVTKWAISSLLLPLHTHIKSIQPVVDDSKSWFIVDLRKKYVRDVNMRNTYLINCLIFHSYLCYKVLYSK